MMNSQQPKDKQLSVADDFSPFPAGRFHDDGEFNGTRFREDFLVPALQALEPAGHLIVTFEGVAGLGSSFLDEAFGGLVRVDGYSKERLDECLEISAGADHELDDFVELALRYIQRAAEG